MCTLPALGLGTCFLGERPETEDDEKAALLRGLSLGMNLIDTAEIYGGGGSERLIGGLFRSGQIQRGDVVLMTKACPQNARQPAIYESCDASLRRLCTDYIDLYLLHWRDTETDLADTVYGMEELVRRGKILRWGVSNFDVSDMEELFTLPTGSNCALNQVMYHIGSRGIEFDLLPWLRKHGTAAVAYSPLAQGGRLRRTTPDFMSSAALGALAKKYGAGIYQVALAFTLREGDVCAIPKSAKTAHVEENAAAAALAAAIPPGEWAALDAEYPPPSYKMHLDMD